MTIVPDPTIQIDVGGKRCIVEHIADDASTLFCES